MRQAIGGAIMLIGIAVAIFSRARKPCSFRRLPDADWVGFCRPEDAQAAPPGPAPPIMFGNFLLFDRKSKTLRGGLRLLVEGNHVNVIATCNPAHRTARRQSIAADVS